MVLISIPGVLMISINDHDDVDDDDDDDDNDDDIDNDDHDDDDDYDDDNVVEMPEDQDLEPSLL